jgi:hypothetical protein
VTAVGRLWRRLRGRECRTRTAVALDRLDGLLEALEAAQTGNNAEAERVMVRLRVLTGPRSGPKES